METPNSQNQAAQSIDENEIKSTNSDDSPQSEVVSNETNPDSTELSNFEELPLSDCCIIDGDSPQSEVVSDETNIDTEKLLNSGEVPLSDCCNIDWNKLSGAYFKKIDDWFFKLSPGETIHSYYFPTGMLYEKEGPVPLNYFAVYPPSEDYYQPSIYRCTRRLISHHFVPHNEKPIRYYGYYGNPSQESK